MLLITIDVGTYSLKILESKIDRKKKIKHINQKEIVIDQVLNIPALKDQPNATVLDHLPFLEEQTQCLQKIFKIFPENSKVVFQVPIDICSTRILEIPIKQKKKAEMMIPFQLEEQIPYSIQDIHMSSYVSKNSDKTHTSITSFIANNLFEELWNHFKKNKILPNYLVPEVTLWNHFISKLNVSDEESYCILDIGHTKSTAYFYNKNKLITYHNCYTAGRSIDEMIISEYGVKYKKAVEFKHQNAFFLLPNQLADVDNKQRDFAQKIDDALVPLIKEFKRWELSFRVNHQKEISKIFITGGTSRIKNIENYLAHNLKKPVRFLTDGHGSFSNMSFSQNDFLSFSNANALSAQHMRKSSNNFLSGQYASVNNEQLPIYSISYVATRVAIVMTIIMVFLGIENFQLQNLEKSITKNVRGVISRKELAFSQREKVKLKSSPKKMLKMIKKKKSTLLRDIETIEEDAGSKGIQGLFLVSERFRTNCHLTQYEDTSSGEINLEFSLCDETELLNLENQVKAIGLKSLNLSKKDESSLKMDFRL